MFAASVPGVLLMVVVAIALMTLIAWLLPMGAPPLPRDLRQETGSGDPSPVRSPDPASWRGPRDAGGRAGT